MKHKGARLRSPCAPTHDKEVCRDRLLVIEDSSLEQRPVRPGWIGLRSHDLNFSSASYYV